MNDPQAFYERYRQGSAHWATYNEQRQAGLIGSNAMPVLGLDETRRYDLAIPPGGDGSLLGFGGAGCGKSAALFANNLIRIPGRADTNNIAYLDPRGEHTAISMLSATLDLIALYSFNPAGFPWAPQHSTNPLDHLTLDSPSLIADTQKSMSDLVPIENTRSKWVDEDAQDWSTQMTLGIVERDGDIDLMRFYRALSSIQGDLDAWCDLLACMERSRFDSVRRFSGQIMQLQRVGREGFTAPIGKLQTTFRFMQDPRIAHALSGNDFSPKDLCQPGRRVRVGVLVPIEYLGVWGPAIRLLMGSIIQYKLRNPGGAKVSIYLDEAGQLGSFPSLRELFTFGRGAGLVGNIAAFQEVSQLYKQDKHVANEIIGSAQYRMFKSVRTLDSAELLSRMCGSQTLEFDREINQSDARRLKQQAAYSLVTGGNFFEAMNDLRHYQKAERHRTKQSRALARPDEILNMGPTEMVMFASGLVGGPIRGHWRMHFDDPRLAGRYLNNPYHGDRVHIRTRFGHKKVPVVEASVPSKYAHLPQCQSGRIRYPKGFPPR